MSLEDYESSGGGGGGGGYFLMVSHFLRSPEVGYFFSELLFARSRRDVSIKGYLFSRLPFTGKLLLMYLDK